MSISAPPAKFDTRTATASSSLVAAPDYLCGVDYFSFKLAVDANYVVTDQSVGTIWLGKRLSPATEAGDGLRISNRDLLNATFAEIDTEWNTGSGYYRALSAQDGDIEVGWDKFDLLGQQLTTSRSIIVRRTDLASKVVAYAVIKVTFPRPL